MASKFKYGDCIRAKMGAPYTNATKNRECENEPTIVIEKHSNKTVAKLFDGIHEKPIRVGVAKCSPEDTFCFETGAALALYRLLGKGAFDRAREAAEKPAPLPKPEIKEGDIVKVKKGMQDYIYSRYYTWFEQNDIPADIAARYAMYRGIKTDMNYRVLKIGPHESNPNMRIFCIEEDLADITVRDVYLIKECALEKVTPAVLYRENFFYRFNLKT